MRIELSEINSLLILSIVFMEINFFEYRYKFFFNCHHIYYNLLKDID